MTQEQVNILLAVWSIAGPIITLLIQKLLTRKKDHADYGSDLLEITNSATEALRKAREEQTASETAYERTIATIRQEHQAAIASIRNEYDARHERLKNRIAELEKVQKIYAIQFDLVTHPNIEVRNITARAMDDVSASQKMKAITNEQTKGEK